MPFAVSDKPEGEVKPSRNDISLRAFEARQQFFFAVAEQARGQVAPHQHDKKSCFIGILQDKGSGLGIRIQIRVRKKVNKPGCADFCAVRSVFIRDGGEEILQLAKPVFCILLECKKLMSRPME